MAAATMSIDVGNGRRVSADVAAIGASADGIARLLGAPCAEFPSAGCLPSVWMWPQLFAWLDGKGRVVRAQFRAESQLELDGVGVFGEPWSRVATRLASRFPDLVQGRWACTLPSLGAKLLLGRSPRGFTAVEEALLLPLGSPEVEAELLLPLAEKYVRPHRAQDRLVSRFLRDLPYSLAQPPQSEFGIVRQALEEGDWSFALLCFLSSAWKHREELAPEEMAYVRALSACLGCTEVEKEARDLACFEANGVMPEEGGG